MVRKIVALALVGGLLVVSACNTVRGAGQDVQKVGEKVEDAAEETGGTDPI